MYCYFKIFITTFTGGTKHSFNEDNLALGESISLTILILCYVLGP
jgi:hypothetical protein